MKRDIHAQKVTKLGVAQKHRSMAFNFFAAAVVLFLAFLFAAGSIVTWISDYNPSWPNWFCWLLATFGALIILLMTFKAGLDCNGAGVIGGFANVVIYAVLISILVPLFLKARHNALAQHETKMRSKAMIRP